MTSKPAQQTEVSVELKSPADTRRLGRALAAAFVAGDFVVLEGSLGAGKTFLVQAIARALGVPTSIPVTSPTFELVHELPGRLPILHADLYRLEPGTPIDELGIVDRIGSDAVVLVEWGDRFAEVLGRDGLWLYLTLGVGKQRSVRLRAEAARGHAMLSRILPQLSAQGLT